MAYHYGQSRYHYGISGSQLNPYGLSSICSTLQSSMYQPKPDLDTILARLLKIRVTKSPYCHLTANECIDVAQQAMEVFMEEPFLQEPKVPCKIVGDLHGQFIDFLRLLSVTGHPPDVAYVFLGDYVDRGPNSIEVLMTLFIYKIKYPRNVILLRGNHESPRINAVYGFMTECSVRFGFSVYRAFNDAFAYMPCAAIVSRRIFCCHGGIIRNLETLDQITSWNPRPILDPNTQSTVTELMWSDPDRCYDGWQANIRGAGYAFGPTALNDFLTRFNLDLLARAHEVVQDGYEFFFGRRGVTIFSAPNYCNQFDNAAAVMNVAADYTCSFTIVRPVSYDFPQTRVLQRGGPGLTQSPVNESTLTDAALVRPSVLGQAFDEQSEAFGEDPWAAYVGQDYDADADTANTERVASNYVTWGKSSSEDAEQEPAVPKRCCVLF